jgi:antitoxin PrlF
VSKLTARLQTTIPSGVRKVLEVGAGDQLEYIINDRRVEVRKAETTMDGDPALTHFLALLERDIASDTPHIRSMPRDLLRRVHDLTRGMEIDHDAPFGDEDAEGYERQLRG